MAEQTETYAEMPWLQSYVSGPFKLPHSMAPYPTDRTAFQDLIDAAETNPNRVYLVFNGKEYTYGEMNEKANKLANSLIEMGLKKGDRVGLICANSPQYLIADSAVLRCGGVIVPISVIHKGPEILYEAQTAGAKMIFVHQVRYNAVMEVKEEAGIENVIVMPVPQWPGYGEPDLSMVPDDAIMLDDLIEKGENVLPDVEIDPMTDLCILPFTGGTTGRPKATMCTHYAMVANTMQTLWWMLDSIKDRVRNKASAVVCIPMFHIYGYWLCHASASWSLRLLLCDPRDIDGMIAHIKKYRPFMVVGVPTHFNQLLNQNGITRGNNMWFSAAAPLPIELAEAVEKANGGMPMAEGYGCSEMTGGTHLNICAVSKMTGFLKKMKRGIGIPVPDTECKILDLETGEEVPFGERGELWVRGPQSMKGYWPNEGSGLQKDGWLATGDVVIMDEDGYFHIVDRVKDMINVSGYKVYSVLVEEAIYELEGVEMAGVIGIPDKDRPGSERVKAFVMPKAEYKGKLTEEQVIAHCEEKLPNYAIPKYVEFRDEFPLTMSGKFLKRVLRDEEIAKLDQEG